MAVSVNSRIKAIRMALKISQRDFSKGIFLSQSSYAKLELEKGKEKANDRIIELVAMKYKVNKEWLKTGKGAMFSSTPPNVKLEQMTEIFNELNELFQNYVLNQIKELLAVQKKSNGKEKEKAN
jgi:transcriptional regulator with XRE-family HTH domain